MEQAKERILKAANKEFSEKGYDGARMGAIARKAKVNQAMLHYYFDTKENLYEQVLLRLFGIGHKTMMTSIPETENFDPPRNLYISIYFLVHLYMNPRNAALERFLHSQIGSGGIKQLIAITKKFLLPQFQFLQKALRMGKESGDFDTSDIEFAAMEIFLYIIAYENFRMYFTDTEVYGHIYGKDYKKRVFDFLIKHTFKGLCPEGKKPVIPAVPDAIIREIDRKINLIKHEMQGGIND